MKQLPSSLVVLFASLVIPAQSVASAPNQTLPVGEVCAEIEKLQTSAESGDMEGYFFVHGLGGLFPVPSFFEVESKGSDNFYASVQTTAPPENWREAKDTLTRAQEIWHDANLCQWSVKIQFGMKSNMGDSEDHLNQVATDIYSLGEMTVWEIDKAALGGEVYAYTIVRDDTYATVFSVGKKAPAYWLLHLFYELNGQ